MSFRGLLRRSSIYAEKVLYNHSSGEWWAFSIFHTAYSGAFLFPTYELLAELYPVLGGYAQQIGDDEYGEGLGEVGHDFALATGNESINLLVSQLPHEVLVFLEAFWGDQSC